MKHPKADRTRHRARPTGFGPNNNSQRVGKIIWVTDLERKSVLEDGGVDVGVGSLSSGEGGSDGGSGKAKGDDGSDHSKGGERGR